MLRVGQYKIGLTEVGLQALCDVLQTRDDPISEFLEYAEVVGADLNESPIEAGFPRAVWRWTSPLTQTDYNTLMGYFTAASGADMFIRTRNNVGGGSETYTVYSARMKRPSGTFSSGHWEEVECQFVALEIP